MTNEDVPPEIGALLASLTEQEPSTDVSSVMRAALAARSAEPLQPAPASNEVVAFARAVADVRTTLSLVRAEHWELQAVNGLTVGELVGHLTGILLVTAAEVGIIPPPNDSDDHLEATRPSIEAARTLRPTAAAAEFARIGALLNAHLSGLDGDALGAPATFGPVVADVRFLLVGRVFELWTHDNDLRGAIGAARVEPDPDRLWMMTRAVMPLVRMIGNDAVRIVLTGPGGGVFPAVCDEIAEIAVDSVAFCRRVANRLDVDRLQAELSGDEAAARNTLTAIAQLALD